MDKSVLLATLCTLALSSAQFVGVPQGPRYVRRLAESMSMPASINEAEMSMVSMPVLEAEMSMSMPARRRLTESMSMPALIFEAEMSMVSKPHLEAELY